MIRAHRPIVITALALTTCVSLGCAPEEADSPTAAGAGGEQTEPEGPGEAGGGGGAGGGAGGGDSSCASGD